MHPAALISATIARAKPTSSTSRDRVQQGPTFQALSIPFGQATTNPFWSASAPNPELDLCPDPVPPRAWKSSTRGTAAAPVELDGMCRIYVRDAPPTWTVRLLSPRGSVDVPEHAVAPPPAPPVPWVPPAPPVPGAGAPPVPEAGAPPVPEAVPPPLPDTAPPAPP